jgi:hypothetical protein
MIRVQGPDGVVIEFPADTSPETIKGVMSRKFGAPEAPKPPDPRDSLFGKIDAGVRGAADMLTFGFADEIAAGLGTGFGFRGDYNAELARQRGIDKADAEQRGGSRLIGQAAGAITGGVGLAKSGLSITDKAIRAGASLPKVAATSAVEGAALGALSGAGAGETAEGRLAGAAEGAAWGLGIGAASPFVVKGIEAVASPVLSPIMARLRPDAYSNAAIGEGLRRSGQGVDDVVDALVAARADGQDMFMLADALDNPGQRLLSTTARTPHDARKDVVKAIMGRQMDQGGRVAAALGDASGSPQTAAQLADTLKAERAATARTNYFPVETDMTAIDVSPAVAAANKAISPAADNLATATGAVPTDLAARAGIEAGEASIRDPIRNAVKEARSYLASDKLTVTNVEKAFRAKTNIDQMIAEATEKGRGAVVKALEPVQKALDDALAATSTQYAAARNAYRQSSTVIDAIDEGRKLASPRNRTQDVLQQFGGMTPEQQKAARVGFFDPLITQAEQRAGKMADSARPYTSMAMEKQLPVIAVQDEAERLGRRLGREMTMSETTAAGLGGPKTADNFADMADMAKFDPGVITNLLAGRPGAAALDAIARLSSEAKGMPPRVVEQVARSLIETRPDVVRQILERAQQKNVANDGIRSVANAILNVSGGSAVGREVAR